jgi:hypothetical protein
VVTYLIDEIIRASGEPVRKRLITDPVEAERLGVKVGDHVLERVPAKYEQSKE